ncbi:MAG: glycosyltransferase family 4 protein [Solobacterium sp.]|nr:glycosyltransferase family 4 protein [Solobacterium sp.]
MKIIQMLPCLTHGDAIGNEVIAIDRALKSNGYKSVIYAEILDYRLESTDSKTIKEWEEPAKDDVIIYHFSIGWRFLPNIRKAKCKKICIYHNITPSHFFKDYDAAVYNNCKNGLAELKTCADLFDYCLADSEFNKQDLISYGFTCPIDVLPILIAFDDYKKEPDRKVIRRYKNQPGANILFVGRVAPNKKQEDIIHAFALYKKYYDKDARLFLIGKYFDTDIYYRRLSSYIKSIGVEDVYLMGHIKFTEILAYYTIADVFLCMSEHEGFCVPLAESMFFHVPIIAYDSTAIPSTLGGSGILFQEKNMLEVAGLIDRVVKDEELRRTIIAGQDARLKDFDNAVIMDQFMTYLRNFIASGK